MTPPMLYISAGVFLACAVALVLASVVLHTRHPDATITAMFDRMLSDRRIHLVVIVLWWWLGWHFLAGQTL